MLPLKESDLAPYFEAEWAGESLDALFNAYLFSLSPSERALLGKRSKAKGMPSALQDLLERKESPEDALAYQELTKSFPPLSLDRLSPEAYEANPYFRLLKGLPPFRQGDISFLWEAMPAYQPFAYREKSFGPHYFDQTPLGYFPEDFPFPCLKKKKRIWMSLVPHEIETMAPDIAKAHGRCLILGLGLGYFAFMASERKEVSELVVLENDPNVLGLFEKHLWPRFPHKEKIHLLLGDAVSYYEAHQGEFDFAYADLWHDAEDGLPLYGELKKKERRLPCSYWIEKDMLAYLRRYAVAYLQEQSEGVGEEAYRDPKTFEERIFAALHAHEEKKPIEKAEDVEAFLGEESLIAILKTI